MSICHVLASDICLSAAFTDKLDDSEGRAVSVLFRFNCWLSIGDSVVKYY